MSEKDNIRSMIASAAGAVLQPIRLWTHQRSMLQAPWLKPNIAYFFMVAGFGSGKSYTGVLTILYVAWKYQGHEVICGMGTTTQTLLRKTMLADLFRLCVERGVRFRYNSQDGILEMGTVKFVSIPTMNPQQIYAYNFSLFICDEIDELPQEKALMLFKAIQERVRIPFPDGRMPFSMFLTTAQGYKGTYQIVTELADHHINHVLVRAKTKDNLALPTEYVQRLYKIYNENERLAFLEGQFVNLSTGRVYYGYDEALCRTGVQPFELNAMEPVHVGQDLNVGFSRGSALVKRGGVLYIVRCWSFGQIGWAPRTMRKDLPQQDIYWYPDASGNEIIAGYASEMKREDIKLRIGTINPSIVDRIFFVNKLFEMGKMKVWDCPETAPLSMALKVRQYNDNGDPEKGKGPESPDHYCDGLEYAVWRIVSSDREFLELWRASRQGRKQLV